MGYRTGRWGAREVEVGGEKFAEVGKKGKEKSMLFGSHTGSLQIEPDAGPMLGKPPEQVSRLHGTEQGGSLPSMGVEEVGGERWEAGVRGRVGDRAAKDSWYQQLPKRVQALIEKGMICRESRNAMIQVKAGTGFDSEGNGMWWEDKCHTTGESRTTAKKRTV